MLIDRTSSMNTHFRSFVVVVTGNNNNVTVAYPHLEILKIIQTHIFGERSTYVIRCSSPCGMCYPLFGYFCISSPTIDDGKISRRAKRNSESEKKGRKKVTWNVLSLL